MIWFYLIALIPIIIGGCLWIYNPKINWIEFVIGSGCALMVAGIMHLVAAFGVASDIQTISGQITQTRQFSEWREFYEEAIYKTESYYTGSGKNRTRHTRRVFSHWSPRTRTHPENWKAYSNIDSSYSIDKRFFLELSEKFGGTSRVKGDRTTIEHNSRMIGGDKYDYIAENKTDYIQPVTKIENWENRVRAAGPSAFSFKKLSPAELSQVHEWPQNNNPWASSRVLNASIDIGEWDRLNARLGPSKRVNLIIINFGDKDPEISEMQKAAWIGAKKNDLVLVYGKGWADCFGWTKSEIVKSNLKTILLNNPVDNSIIPLIEKEVRENYELRDFEKDFSYLSIEPRGVHYFWLIFTMIVTQAGFYFFAHHNPEDKESIGEMAKTC